MTDTEEINREVFEAYEEECQRIAECIQPKLPEAGEGAFDGHAWCEEQNIPETAFAHAINYHLDEAEYGVTPMRPWKTPPNE